MELAADHVHIVFGVYQHTVCVQDHAGLLKDVVIVVRQLEVLFKALRFPGASSSGSALSFDRLLCSLHGLGECRQRVCQADGDPVRDPIQIRIGDRNAALSDCRRIIRQRHPDLCPDLGFVPVVAGNVLQRLAVNLYLKLRLCPKGQELSRPGISLRERTVRESVVFNVNISRLYNDAVIRLRVRVVVCPENGSVLVNVNVIMAQIVVFDHLVDVQDQPGAQFTVIVLDLAL